MEKKKDANFLFFHITHNLRKTKNIELDNICSSRVNHIIIILIVVVVVVVIIVLAKNYFMTVL